MLVPALVSFLALSGCTVGPFYHKPAVPTPAAWRPDEAGGSSFVQTTAAKPNATEALWPSSEWWRGFNSTNLNELMSQAQQTNDDIAAAVARVREADAQVKIVGASLLPTITANGEGTRARSVSLRTSPAGTSSPTLGNAFTAELAASYQLDFWGKNLAERRSAKYAADASRYDRTTVELGVMTSVANTYFEALALHDRITVAEENLATAQKVLDALRFGLQVGTINALDVAQEETTFAQVNAAIPPLREQFRQQVNALAILVGKAPQDLEFPGGLLTDLAEPSVAPGMPSELLARRPDVAESEAQLKAANADIGAARAAFFPDIGLTAEGGFESAALSSLFTPASRLYSISGSLVQTIFAGGALTGRYQQTKARYSELLADYHKSVISAFGDVENSLVALQQTADQYARQQEVVAKAQRAYEFTDAQMRAGVVNVLTVLNTQTTLFNAQDVLVQVRLAHLQSLVQLFGALGGGWQRP